MTTLSKYLFLAILPLLSLETKLEASFLQFSKKERASSLEYESSFRSTIFDHYYLELCSFIQTNKSPLEKEQITPSNHPLFTLRQLFTTNLPQDGIAKRAFHTAFLTRLRVLLFSQPHDNLQLVNQVCFWMYTQPHLLENYWQFLHTLPTQPPLLNGALNSFPAIVEGYYQQLKKNGQLNGYYPLSLSHTDPHYSGQIPSAIYRIGETTLVHFSRPLIEDKKQKSVFISPEFKAYLSYLRSKQQTHLYINLMHRQGKESHLSKILERLEEDPEFESVIAVATLDKNSPFYWQKNEYAFLSKAAEFKKIFLNQLLTRTKEAVFKWPNKIPLDEWKQVIYRLINTIHIDYFSERSVLSRPERQQFIEIMLVKLIEALIEREKPSFCNISCKHSIDRGPSMLSLFYAYNCLQAQKKWSEADEQLILTLLFAPALVAHNRPPHTYRLQRFNLTLQKFGESAKEMNTAH